MSEGFEILPHTADMRMRVWGKSIQELFRAALRGMAFYLRPDFAKLPKGAKPVTQAVKVETVDISSLLVEFLSEVIAQSDISNAVFTAVNFRKFGENFLEGEISGFVAEDIEHDIKAVSYHEVDIKRNPETGLFETMLVFDI